MVSPLFATFLEKSASHPRRNQDALKRILLNSGEAAKLARWIVPFFDLDCRTKYCAQMKKQAADAIARLRTAENGKTEMPDGVPVLQIFVEIDSDDEDLHGGPHKVLC